VAKLVDALCSGRSIRKDVLVRIQSWAPLRTVNSSPFIFSENPYPLSILQLAFLQIFNHMLSYFIF
jgi:hypothetical protein